MEITDKLIIADVTASMMAHMAHLQDQDCKALLKECAVQLLAKAGYELTDEPGVVRPITKGRRS